jgi:glycosyltransferase involved in cell wall biosynthesis
MTGTLETVRERLRPWYLRNIYFRVFPSRKPRWFDDCWRFPHVPIERCSDLLDSPDPGSRDFLIFPMTDWHARQQRTQFFAQALAALGHRCFILNPHLGREFRGPEKHSALLGRLAKNIYELHVRLPREPVYHHRNLTEAESKTLATVVLGLVEKGRLLNITQLVSFPVWLPLARLVKAGRSGKLICDCHDQLSGFAGVAPEIVAQEPALIASSDFVICSADQLREHCLVAGASPDRCIVVRNAVTAQQFIGVPARPRQGSPPVIGYLGALEDWFDSNAVRAAAIARPDWRFVIAGRVESSAVASELNLPNVEFPGEIGRDRVPEILAGFDVATIPFRINPLTTGADPIKIYEYLAAGLPVVSSRLPETQRFGRFIHYYNYENAAEDFAHAVESALDDSGESRRRERQLAVRDETWESRCRQILAL